MFRMTIKEKFGDVLFLLSFRWSISDERSFAYAQDDKGKEFGMTFFLFCHSNDIFLVFTVPMTFFDFAILMIFFAFIIPGIFLLFLSFRGYFSFLSFRGTIVTRNLILTSNKFFISILLVNRIKVL